MDKQNVPSGYLIDVYDGRLWTEWATHNTPGNRVLMLNVDWFKPFVHTQYSVKNLVIQNLPRSNQIQARKYNRFYYTWSKGTRLQSYERIPRTCSYWLSSVGIKTDTGSFVIQISQQQENCNGTV